MKNQKLLFVGTMLLLIISILLGCCVGRFPLTLKDIGAICVGTMEETMKRDVLLKIRLPRLLFAGMTGAGLSAAGMVYQELFHNPLASPDVLGVSGGAGVGAALAILLGTGIAGVQAFALSFGLLSVLLALLLGRFMGRRNPVNLILAGIVVKALSDASLMALKYLADPQRQLAAIDYWLMGSFQTAMWKQVKAALPITVAVLAVLWLMRHLLFVLSLGEEEAESLGIPAGKLRIFSIILATVLVAAGVSVTGQIAWMALIVPHMVRIFTGENLMKSFGSCALLGAALMILTDTAARSLTASEIPISILTSLAGAVFLLAALLRYRRKGGFSQG